MQIDVQRNNENGLEPSNGAADATAEAMRSLARWLYGRLQEAYNDETSDEAVHEAMKQGDWLFTVEGGTSK